MNSGSFNKLMPFIILIFGCQQAQSKSGGGSVLKKLTVHTLAFKGDQSDVTPGEVVKQRESPVR